VYTVYTYSQYKISYVTSVFHEFQLIPSLRRVVVNATIRFKDVPRQLATLTHSVLLQVLYYHTIY